MKYVAIALTCLMLGACSLHANPGRTKVSTGGVTIETDGYPNGRHCPPGHAKKGWC